MTLADSVGIFTNLLVAATALVALLFGWRQIRISRELSALEAYEQFHLTCLANVEFLTNDVPFERLSPEEYRRFETFVLYTMMMDERIYVLFPKDDGWLFAIKEDLRLHRRFLASPQFEKHLSKQMWAIKPLIDEVLAEAAPTAQAQT